MPSGKTERARSLGHTMELWKIWLLFIVPWGLYHFIYVLPQTQRLWTELVALTGDKKLAHKLLQRAIAKHWWRGQVYWYEIALASYKHHLAIKPRPQMSARKTVDRSASHYRPKTAYKAKNRPSTTPQPMKSASSPPPVPPSSQPVSPSGLRYGLKKPVKSTSQAKSYRPKTAYKPRNRSNSTPQVPRPTAREEAPIRLILKLDQLTRDRETSERLIDRAALRYPERSKQWCVEKVIFDLERDRH